MAPHCFHRPDYGLVVLAGMWKMQQQRDGAFALAFVVLATQANAVMEPIHDRIPVVLAESKVDEWMDAKAADAPLPVMLKPAPDGYLIAGHVSPLVNNVRNDEPP